MAGTNNFLPFGTAGGANVMAQVTYAGLGDRSNGFQSGDDADAAASNKVWRQSAFWAYALGDIIARTNRDALDNNDMATLTANLLAALAELVVWTPPPGLLFYAASLPPGRFLPADGQLLARVGTYAGLFGAIGTAFNTGGEDGDHFRNMDARGVVIRGQDAGRGLDPSRALGSYQADQNKAHYHLLPQVGDSSCINQYLYGATDISPTDIATLDNKSANVSLAARTSNGAESGGTEVRVKNLALRGYVSY